MLRVLILPGTTQIAKEIRTAIELEKGIELFGAGSNVTEESVEKFIEYEYLGPEWSTEVPKKLEEIVQKFCIDLIYPAHDQWIYNLCDFTTIGRAQIICHPKEAIKICSLKSETYKFFKDRIPVPLTFDLSLELNSFPIVLKPNRGQGSVGFRKISNIEELRANFNDYFQHPDVGNTICTTFLPGAEYTVDCFSSTDSNVVYARGRLRKETNNGLAILTEDSFLKEFTEYAKIISSELSLRGAWFFQVKDDSQGIPTLLEIGLRPAGASSIRRAQGVNLPLMSIHQTLGKEITALDHNINTVASRVVGASVSHDFCFERVYVDLDDTLIINGGLNTKLIEFLFFCSEKNIDIFLITRNTGDLTILLTELKLIALFSEVIYVPAGTSKSSKIQTRQNFLFIDDSFSERLDMFNVFSNQVLTVDQSAFSMNWLPCKT